MLQTFLYIQVFILGVLVALAARFAYHAFFKHPTEQSGKQRGVTPQAYIDLDLPSDVKQRLLHESQAQFESAVRNSATHLQHNLDTSSEEINNLIKNLAADVVQNELQRFHKQLGQLEEQTEAEMGSIKSEIAKHQEELKAKLAQDIEIEKKMLIRQIDTKLADAVSSFLLETLQHNVDLGNQNAYLISMLEEHKGDFIKEVGQDEHQPTK